MLTAAIGRLRTWLAACDPWTNVYGLARSLLALAGALTLGFNRSAVLFRPLAGHNFKPPMCISGLQKLDLFCALPGPLPLRQWVATLLLLVVASGWRPRITGVIHWFVALSFQLSATTLDGGDQATAVLALLLLPVTLTDDRRWHWSSRAVPTGSPLSEREECKRLVARVGLMMARIQVAVIYFHAATGKLKVTEWVDGTAMYYWMTHPVFGANSTLKPWLLPLLENSVSVCLLTWGVIALEMFLLMGLLATRPARRWLLAMGILFHSAIIFVQGLTSFGMVMFAALVLYLRPADELFSWPSWLLRVRVPLQPLAWLRARSARARAAAFGREAAGANPRA
jgi:antimicrobial peptide system SdpB family protein